MGEIPCHEQTVELDTVMLIDAPLKPGQTYKVIVNDVETTTFTLPKPDIPYTFVAESPIESAEVLILESDPPQYQLRVVSGMPRSSGCSQFNGYEIRRKEADKIEVVVTHHQVSDPEIVCTADYPIVETNAPLGSDFETGAEYTVTVNGETVTSFTAS